MSRTTSRTTVQEDGALRSDQERVHDPRGDRPEPRRTRSGTVVRAHGAKHQTTGHVPQFESATRNWRLCDLARTSPCCRCWISRCAGAPLPRSQRTTSRLCTRLKYSRSGSCDLLLIASGSCPLISFALYGSRSYLRADTIRRRSRHARSTELIALHSLGTVRSPPSR
jgi:hypothetical protein